MNWEEIIGRRGLVGGNIGEERFGIRKCGVIGRRLVNGDTCSFRVTT